MRGGTAFDVLIVDDEPEVAEALASLLTAEGFSSAGETDAARAVERASEARVVLLDLRIPGVDGFSLLDEMRRRHPRLPVVMVTAHGTVKHAVEAMRHGAFDFVVKPPSRAELAAAVGRAAASGDADRALSELFFDLPCEVVFRDPRTLDVLERLRRAAPTDLAVLLAGETGVGKEVFARLLHEWSPRSGKPLVKINCAAVPEALFESEMFGHEKGAFTGATVSKPGRVELADGGTLFLDEIGELPLPAQAKLLEFLQDRTHQRVGGLRTLRTDVRLVVATNRTLRDEVEAGRFRRDLFFRVAGLELEIPPLRARPGDVEALARHFAARFGARYARKAELAEEALAALQAHAWPGNVRELEHVVERAVALAAGPLLGPGDFFPKAAPAASPVAIPAAATAAGGLREDRRAFEKERVVLALRASGGNRTEAARALGISRRMLQIKIRDFGLAEE